MISVIIPTFNRLTPLFGTLTCLLNQRVDVTFEIIVVDSGSDQTGQVLTHHWGGLPQLRYLKVAPTRNRSRLRNLGAAEASFDTLVFVDGDMLMPPDFLQTHFEFHSAGEGKVLLGKRRSLTDFDPAKFGWDTLTRDFHLLGRLPYYHDYRDQFLSQAGLSIGEVVCPWRFFFSHNLSIQRALFERLGGFNEAFGEDWGYEDIELGYRVHCAGIELDLDEDHPGYHQPHLEQSRRDQPLAAGNALLFSKTYPTFEVEMVSLLGTDLGGIAKDIQRVYEDVGNGMSRVEHCPEVNHVTLGYLHSASDPAPPPLNHHLGLFLQHQPEKSKDLAILLPTFHHFGEWARIGILFEAFRVARSIRILGCTNEAAAKIESTMAVLGVEAITERKGTVVTLTSLSANAPKKIVVVVPPSPFEPRRRFGYLELSLVLQERGFQVVLRDPKRVTTCRGDGFGDRDCESLDAMLSSPYEYLAERQFVPAELAISEFCPRLGTGSKVFDDIGYRLLDGYSAVRPMPGVEIVEPQFLDLFTIRGLLRSSQPRMEQATQADCFTIFASMDTGFDEDGIEAIVQAFGSLFRRCPNSKLVIKCLDIDAIVPRCMAQHNEASRKLKLQSIQRKSERDRSLLFLAVQKCTARGAIEIVTQNWSPVELLANLNSFDVLVCATRGCAVPTEVWAGLVLGMTVIVPDHLELLDDLEDPGFCLKVKTTRNPFADAFGIAETSMTVKLTVNTVSVADVDARLSQAVAFGSRLDLRRTPSQISGLFASIEKRIQMQWSRFLK